MVKMVLLFRNINSYLLVAIEYVKMMLSCRFGTEAVIYALSKHKFGDISIKAKDVITMTQQGMMLNDAIDNVIMSIKNNNHKKFWMAMKSEQGVNVIARLNELSTEIMKQRELAISNLVDSLSSNLNKIVIAESASLLVFLIPVFNQTAKTSEVFANIQIPEIIVHYIPIAVIVIIIFLLINTRYKETQLA